MKSHTNSEKSKNELPILTWTFNNTKQCWNCANMISESPPVSLTDIQEELEPLVRYEHFERVPDCFLFILPECRCCDTYMAYVSHSRCPYYEPRKEKTTDE